MAYVCSLYATHETNQEIRELEIGKRSYPTCRKHYEWEKEARGRSQDLGLTGRYGQELPEWEALRASA